MQSSCLRGLAQVKLRNQRASDVPGPYLLFFTSATSGRYRRVEGYLAQCFSGTDTTARFVSFEWESELAHHFDVDEAPTLISLMTVG